MMIEQIQELSKNVQRLRGERDALLKHGFPLPDPDAVPKLRIRAEKYERIESPQRDGEWTLGTHHIHIPSKRDFQRASELRQKLRNTQQASELWRKLLVKEKELEALQSRQKAVVAFT